MITPSLNLVNILMKDENPLYKYWLATYIKEEKPTFVLLLMKIRPGGGNDFSLSLVMDFSHFYEGSNKEALAEVGKVHSVTGYMD